jgi:hypothetical protein
MGMVNEYTLSLQQEGDGLFSLEDELIKRYPGLCVQCGHVVCICPPVPEATVGRMAKEPDIQDICSKAGLLRRFKPDATDTTKAP